MERLVGITVHDLTVHKGERLSEIFFVALAGSDVSASATRPIISKSLILTDIPRGEIYPFAGEGLLIFPPSALPTNGLVAWWVAMFESDQGIRSLGDGIEEQIDSISAALDGDHPIAQALAIRSGKIALSAIEAVGRGISTLLQRRGDRTLLTWAGTVYGHQLAGMLDSTFSRRSRWASATFGLVSTVDEGKVL